MVVVSLSPRIIFYGLRVLGIIGGIGSGCYCMHQMVWINKNFRFAIIYFYMVVFSSFIISAELGLLEHRSLKKLGRFLTTCIGRAIFYIFIGGLQLSGYGLIPGVYMLCVATLNIFVQISCSDQMKRDLAVLAGRDMTAIGSSVTKAS